MDPLTLADKKVPKKDLVTGITASLLIHVLAFGMAFVWALSTPRKALKPPYCSVNLVSLKDLEIGSPEPQGTRKGTEETVVSKKTPTLPKVRRKARPVVPIKRLAVSEPVKRHEAQIKKIEPKEQVHAEVEKLQGLEAIEKNLDKLIAKPKVVPKSSSASTQRAEHQRPAPNYALNHPQSKKITRGTPKGPVQEGSRGVTQGSTFGSTSGSGAINRIASLYVEQVKQKIESEWRLVNDQGISGLKAVVAVRVTRTGQVVSVVLMSRSGNAFFDEAAVRAVNKAAPLPPVPEAIAQGNTELIMTFMPGRVS